MQKKIKILFTIPNFDTAGSGKVLYDLICGLDDTKFDINIACDHDRGTLFKEVEKLGYPIFLFQTNIDYRPYHSFFTRLLPVIFFFKKNNFEIIHSWHWSSDWTEALAAKMIGVKWIYTKKSMSWGNRHWKLRSFLADFIITINDEMRIFFPYKKSQQIIPIGLNTDYYRPQNEKLYSESNDFVILSVANLVPVKGIEVLIDAIAHLKDNEIMLNVIGSSSEKYLEFLQDRVRNLNLQDQINFSGKKKDVRSYVNAGDLYVIPTLNKGRKEGMPMALVEAMSMGKPVLGSDISGIRFVLKDFKDLLFPAGDVTALAEKINYLKRKDKDSRNRLGVKLRQHVIKNYSLNDFVKKHERLYIKLLNRKNEV